jgi:hypothetical protein
VYYFGKFLSIEVKCEGKFKTMAVQVFCVYVGLFPEC